MRPLKIAFVSRWYWEENRRHDSEEGGGTQQLAEAVAALGHEVVVLSQSPMVGKLKKAQVGTLETWLSPRDKRGDPLTALRDKWDKRTYTHRKVYSDARDLRRFLARRGPFDVIWAHAESPDGLVIAIAGQMGGRLPPYLVQVQALRYRFKKGEPIFTEKVPLGLAFRHAARILVASELVATSLRHYAGPGLSAAELQAKVQVVRPNLQRAFFRAAEESSTWPQGMKDRVLFLGALNSGKGALAFMDALPKTEAAKRNATFAIIGDFTQDDPRFFKRWAKAQEEVRLHLPGARTEYLGHVSSFEVIRQIRMASVVVIPSLFDAFSRALAEALILGRPVITTDKVGAFWLVRNYGCGIVIPPHDAPALADAIDASLSPLVPFAQKARELSPRLVLEFSTEFIATQIAQHLSEIAAPAKAPKTST